MVDYQDWLHNTEEFLRGLIRLPGRISVHAGIQPPVQDDCFCDSLEPGECNLPPEVVRFLATGTRRCSINYQWTPPPEFQSHLSALYPNQLTLFGGGDFCEFDKFTMFYNRSEISDIFVDSLGESLANAILGQAISGLMETEHERGRLPLMELLGGDSISLQLEPFDGDRSVVLVAADDSAEPIVLSPNFDQFLIDWQQLCYIRPNRKSLAPWIDPAAGRLNLDCEATGVLHQLLNVAWE